MIGAIRLSSWKQTLRGWSYGKVRLRELRSIVEISLHVKWVAVDILHALDAGRRRVGGIAAAKLTWCLTVHIVMTLNILRTLVVELDGARRSGTRIHAIHTHISVHIIQIGQVLRR